MDPEVIRVVCDTLRDDFGNPSSIHPVGKRAKAVIEQARAEVALLLGNSPEEVCFTSGGTESNNLAILGTAGKHPKGHIITSSIEHPSVTAPLKRLEDEGYQVTRLLVSPEGMVSARDVEAALRKDTILITIMHSNNETGVLQPIAEIGRIAKRHKVVFHTDASQSVGKVPVDFAEADLLTVASHKFYGPKGVGALVVRQGLEPKPVLLGAQHEHGLRPGTENVPAIAGLGKACELARLHLAQRVEFAQRLGQLLLDELKEKIPGVSLNGHATLRLPNTLSLRLPPNVLYDKSVLSNKSVQYTDAADIALALSGQVAVSAGSACHSGARSPSAVLKAMGLTDREALCSVRISTGKDNTELEIKEAAGLISGLLLQQGQAL